MSRLKESTTPRERTVTDDAARWFLRLQENAASSQTFLEWQQWLNAAPAHRQAYEAIEDTVLRLGSLSAGPALPCAEELARDTYDGSLPIADWQQAKNESGARKQASSPRWRFAVAAAVTIVAFGGGWLWLRQQHAAQLGEFAYQTLPGERHRIELPDGSRVTLDADSALDVGFTLERRSLTLKRGEAFFEVAKNPNRPFVVRAGSTQVTAIGTAFNVRIGDGRTVIAVTEGKVDFVAIPQLAVSPSAGNAAPARVTDTRPRLTAQVAAGEGVSYLEDGNLQVLPAREAPLAVSWLGGRRQYRNEALRYVLADVDRYTGRAIELGNEAVGELRFTGTLNLSNSDAWLRGLSVALPVVVTEKPDGVLLIEQRGSEIR